jgi:3-methyladenine DNA glycosylase AlkD
MMTAGKVVSEIEASLRAATADDTPTIRAVRRAFSRRLADMPPEFVLEVCRQVLARGTAAHRLVAYELVYDHHDALRSLRQKELLELCGDLDSWSSVDIFACCLAGPVWRLRQIPDSVVRRWATSRDRWWRRAALVSTVPLNSKARGGDGDTERTLLICGMLAADRDDMVGKALSWALRELAKRDPRAVQAFLAEHRTVLSARVGREVRNKLAYGSKHRPLDAKKRGSGVGKQPCSRR